MRTEYAIDEGTAAAMARASVRYRLLRPAFVGAVVVELLIAAMLFAAGEHGWAGFLAAVAVAQPVLVALQLPMLAGAMQFRGYRPGTTMVGEWEPETFVIESGGNRGEHRYDQARAGRVVGGALVFRLGGARVLLVLPLDFVPPYARSRLLSRSVPARP